MASETDATFFSDPYSAADKVMRAAFERLEPAASKAVLDAWRSGSGVGVACSGGLDSVFLLCLVAAWSRHNGGHLSVLHFNHATRGSLSDGDEVFVERMAMAFGIPIMVDRIEPDGAEDPGRFSEDRLRRHRLRALHRMLKASGMSMLLTAHHGDDRLESFLMRLSMGAPPESLLVPKAVHVMSNGCTHVRLLLRLSKVELRKWMLEAGIPWREDASNASNSYYRNRVRNQLLPLWRSGCPYELDSNLARSLMEIGEDSLWMEQQADRVWNSLMISDGKLDVSTLEGLPRPIIRRVLARWIPDFPHRHRTILLDAIEQQKHFHLPLSGGKVLELRKGVISIRAIPITGVVDLSSSPDWGYAMVPGFGNVAFPDGRWLRCEAKMAEADELNRIRSGKYPCEDTVFLDKDTLEMGGGLYVSFWQPGDGYRPLGSPGWKKLQDQFVDRKVPPEMRRMLPVVRLVSSHAILWVPGLPPCESGRVTGHTKTLLKLTYT